MNKLLSGIALTAMLGAGFASCTTDVDGLGRLDKNHLVVNKAPKIVAYSGNHTWGTDLQDPFKVKRYQTDEKSGITWVESECVLHQDDYKAEVEYINKKLPEKANSLDEDLDDDFLFYYNTPVDVELYPFSGQSGTDHIFGIYYFEKGNPEPIKILLSENLKVDTNTEYGEPDLSSWTSDPNHYQGGYYTRWGMTHVKGIKVTVPAGVKFGFYFNGNNETGPTIYYTSFDLNEEVRVDGEERTSKVHAVTWNANGKTYLGLEDWRDFDFQDLVFTITPELKTSNTDEKDPNISQDPKDECDQCGHDSHLPGTCPDCDDPEDGCYVAPPTEDKCEQCGHDSHLSGTCPDCDDPEDGCYVPPTENEGCPKCGHETHLSGNCPTCDEAEQGGCYKPSTPPVVAGDDHTNEVEVNLAVDTKGETSGGKYNESHLSIHVRSAVDIDMFIPMPLEYICPADDMEIVKQHLQGDMQHGGEFQNATMDKDGKVVMQGGLLSMMEYDVEGYTVRLYVEYVAVDTNTAHQGCDRTFEEPGIHIWSEGLEGNTELFNTLQEKYGDGITFEIWNYFNPELTIEKLKPYLDRATIEFIGDKLPDYFINAFGSANYEEGKDCTVGLEESQADNFEWKGEGGHLNGSNHNQIYENKNRKSPTEPAPAQ